MTLAGKTILFFAGPLYEDLELWYPKIRLEEEGARTVVAGTGEKTYQGKRGYPLTVDTNVDQIEAGDFDGLVIPGGYAPDIMRRSPKLLQLTRDIYEADKPVAFICHAGWVPISAGIVRGKRGTSVGAIRDDLVNAGMLWEDSPVVVDGNLISSRTPADLPDFMRALIGALRVRARPRRSDGRQPPPAAPDSSRAMSLSEAQRRVDAWISQYEEGYFHPLTNLARLSEEVGELAREVNHRFGQKTKKQDEAEGDLGMEMADILFVLICMANREGIDLAGGVRSDDGEGGIAGSGSLDQEGGLEYRRPIGGLTAAPQRWYNCTGPGAGPRIGGGRIPVRPIHSYLEVPMSSNLLASLNGLITPDVLSAASRQLGDSEGAISKGLGASFSSILLGLVSKAGSPEALRPAFDLITNPANDATVLEDPRQLLSASSDFTRRRARRELSQFDLRVAAFFHYQCSWEHGGTSSILRHQPHKPRRPPGDGTPGQPGAQGAPRPHRAVGLALQSARLDRCRGTPRCGQRVGDRRDSAGLDPRASRSPLARSPRGGAGSGPRSPRSHSSPCSGVSRAIAGRPGRLAIDDDRLRHRRGHLRRERRRGRPRRVRQAKAARRARDQRAGARNRERPHRLHRGSLQAGGRNDLVRLRPAQLRDRAPRRSDRTPASNCSTSRRSEGLPGGRAQDRRATPTIPETRPPTCGSRRPGPTTCGRS